MRSAPPCCAHGRRARLAVVLVVTALALAAPLLARCNDLVAEAAFLDDTLPPEGRDLNLSLTVVPVEDPAPGEARFTAVPRVQLATGLAPRLGLTVDVGLGMDARRRLYVDTPGASLKLLLREPGEDRTGVAVSLDAFGDTETWRACEVGVGLGAVRAIGNVTLRGTVWAVTDLAGSGPHADVGVSAATALGARVRVLGEVVGEFRGGRASLAVGPTVKVALSEGVALSAGALVRATPAAAPLAFVVQLTHGI